MHHHHTQICVHTAGSYLTAAGAEACQTAGHAARWCPRHKAAPLTSLSGLQACIRLDLFVDVGKVVYGWGLCSRLVKEVLSQYVVGGVEGLRSLGIHAATFAIPLLLLPHVWPVCAGERTATQEGVREHHWKDFLSVEMVPEDTHGRCKLLKAQAQARKLSAPVALSAQDLPNAPFTLVAVPVHNQTLVAIPVHNQALAAIPVHNQALAAVPARWRTWVERRGKKEILARSG
eukprot:1152789-Pelagomonas_calceolata.AAC.4